MKMYNIRNIAFLLLVSASIFSYTYLSCVSVDTTTTNSTTTIEDSTEEAATSVQWAREHKLRIH